jgi:hypothetical protein
MPAVAFQAFDVLAVDDVMGVRCPAAACATTFDVILEVGASMAAKLHDLDNLNINGSRAGPLVLAQPGAEGAFA